MSKRVWDNTTKKTSFITQVLALVGWWFVLTTCPWFGIVLLILWLIEVFG